MPPQASARLFSKDMKKRSHQSSSRPMASISSPKAATVLRRYGKQASTFPHLPHCKPERQSAQSGLHDPSCLTKSLGGFLAMKAALLSIGDCAGFPLIVDLVSLNVSNGMDVLLRWALNQVLSLFSRSISPNHELHLLFQCLLYLNSDVQCLAGSLLSTNIH
jgi:hypothetical protein